MGIDYTDVRKRIKELRIKCKKSNFEFCKIYAPEKCKKQKASAENYMSAIITGNNYPNETNGSAKIELEHLQNLIDSNLSPGLTMNYLLYGDDTPVKEKEVVQTDIHHWTLADLCGFLFGMLREYSGEIEYYMSEPEEYEVHYVDGETTEETRFNLALKFLEMDSLSGDGCGLGLGLRVFIEEFQKCQDITSSKARDVAFQEMMEAIRSDDRYKTPLCKCHYDNGFLEYDSDGPQIKGLKND